MIQAQPPRMNYSVIHLVWVIMAVSGYGVVCASRSGTRGGRVALLVRDGLTYRERPDLRKFDEGQFESVFIEIIRGRGRRNDVIGVVYRENQGEMRGSILRWPGF